MDSSHSVVMSGDTARLVQIVVNLLVNAAKFTDSGGSTAMTLEHDSNRARIKVRDTGIGIEPELLPTIFDLYVQAEPAQSRAPGADSDWASPWRSSSPACTVV